MQKAGFTVLARGCLWRDTTEHLDLEIQQTILYITPQANKLTTKALASIGNQFV